MYARKFSNDKTDSQSAKLVSIKTYEMCKTHRKRNKLKQTKTNE